MCSTHHNLLIYELRLIYTMIRKNHYFFTATYNKIVRALQLVCYRKPLIDQRYRIFHKVLYKLITNAHA